MTDWTWASPAPGSFDELNGVLNPKMKALENRLGNLQNGLSDFRVEDYGATGGGVTDDTANVQFALDQIASDDGRLSFAPGTTYRCDTLLTMISTDTASTRHTKTRIIEGNGATLDFSNATYTTDYLAGNQTDLFTVGTQVNTSTPSDPKAIIERGILAIRNLRIVGPEAQPPFAAPSAASPVTGTVGLRLQLAHDVELTNVVVTNCVVGVETKDSWGITGTNVHVSNCWFGFHISGGSTYASWLTCGAIQCPYAILLQSSTRSAAPFYGAFAAVSSQSFFNFLFEDVWYGTIMYAHDTNIRGVQVIGAYTEGISRDLYNVGLVLNRADLADPASTLSDATPGFVDRLYLEHCSRLNSGGSFKAFRGPTGGDFKIVHSRLTLAALEDRLSSNFLSTTIEFLGADDQDAGTVVYYDTAGAIVVRIDLHNGNISLGGVLTTSTITTLANDATPTVAASNLFKTGGTTAITDFDDGVVGQTIKILSEHAITITDGTNILLNGSANFVMAAGDVLVLTMYNDQVWVEDSRQVN